MESFLKGEVFRWKRENGRTAYRTAFFVSTWLVMLLTLNISAQSEVPSRLTSGSFPTASVAFESFASSATGLPFWMTSNRLGSVPRNTSTYQLLQLSVASPVSYPPEKIWQWSYGLSGEAGYGHRVDFRLNHAFAALTRRALVLQAGGRPDDLRYAGLSSTNGNLLLSRNARPLPGISLYSSRFIPSPLWGKLFSFSFRYEELFAADTRREKGVHLHHKQLLVRAGEEARFSATAGVDHWVYWGGRSASGVEQPGWESYFRYVTGRKGGSSANVSDQINVAGNGLGMYRLILSQRWNGGGVELYWNHPFEDRSGMLLWNKKDGFWGVSFKREGDGRPALSSLLYEYMYTVHQSGSRHMVPDPDDPSRLIGKGGDNYFNHGFYRTGHANSGFSIGSPLFVPIMGSDGFWAGFDNNRIIMHHGGASGYFGPCMAWKGLLTWSRSLGTYGKPFPEPLEQVSGLLEVSWTPWSIKPERKLPLSFRLLLAADRGDRFEHRYGASLGVSWQLSGYR